uniref:Uncharacterized protein n=1 Tax=Panagrolaimus sp. PS1159 TaxID=55785 RepID=A0AC35FJY0_9BILA
MDERKKRMIAFFSTFSFYNLKLSYETELATQLSGICSRYTAAEDIAGCHKLISFEGFAQIVQDTSVDPNFGINAVCSGYCQ